MCPEQRKRGCTVLQRLQAAVVQEAVFVQRLGDVVTEVGDGVDDGGLLGSPGVVPLHQVVLQRDEVQSVVGHAAAIHLHLQSDGVVDLDHQAADGSRAERSVCFRASWKITNKRPDNNDQNM